MNLFLRFIHSLLNVNSLSRFNGGGFKLRSLWKVPLCAI